MKLHRKPCISFSRRGELMRHYLVAMALAVAVGATTLGAGLQGPPAGAQGQAPGGPGGRGGGGQRGAPAGPPAPVPPEVAMQRPTADELARINAALKRFVDTNTSADSAVLKKYADLINVPTPRANPAIAPVQTGRARTHVITASSRPPRPAISIFSSTATPSPTGGSRPPLTEAPTFRRSISATSRSPISQSPETPPGPDVGFAEW